MLRRLAIALSGVALIGATNTAQPETGSPAPPASAIDALFKRYDSKSTPGCSVAVIKAGKVIFQKSYGMADPALGAPMTRSTTNWIPYSETRLFLALAVAILSREGKISLDDPVRRFVPEVPQYAAAVTVRQLLHHRSGLPDYGTLAGPGWELGDRMSEDEFFRIISRWGSLTFQPGSGEMYSNTDYALLKILVERVSGNSLQNFLTARLFRPLDMNATRIGFDQGIVTPNHALFHQPSNEGFQKVLRYRVSPVGQISVTTSLDDIIRFDGALRSGALDIPAMIELLKSGASPTATADGDQGFSFGLYRRTHKGIPLIEYRGIGGYTYLVQVPGRDLSIATLCNIYEGMGSFGPDVAALYTGPALSRADAPQPVRRPPAVPKSRSTISVPLAELRALTGEYHGPRGGSNPVDITLIGDKLVFKPRGREAVPPLKPLGSNIFETTFQGSPFIVWFERDGDEMILSAWDVAANEPAGDDLRRQRRWQPSAAELGTYSGTYVGDRVDMTFYVRAEGDQLLIAGRGLAEDRLAPGMKRDEFSFPSDYSARFERDPSGKVIALVLNSTRIQGIRLTRR